LTIINRLFSIIKIIFASDIAEIILTSNIAGNKYNFKGRVKSLNSNKNNGGNKELDLRGSSNY
ncbi:hypothetical protein OFB51_24870, partial [Escherichia coli]|nr:hypothetical protein [Escherichia coli]